MAIKIAIQTLGSVNIYLTDTDPSAGIGLSAPIGSFGIAEDNSGFFAKTSALATGWLKVALLNSSGILPISSGGTGTSTTFTPGSIVFAGASGIYSQNNANFFWDNSNLRLGIKTASPTAILDLGASIAANSSLRIRAGVAPTVPNSGDVWHVSPNLFFNDGTSTKQIAKCLTGSAVLDFPNTLAQNSSELTIAVAGATPGDVVSLGIPSAATARPANTCYTAYVSAGNTVTVRFNNYSAVAVNPTAGTFAVTVFKNI